ncbi:MAG: ROK family protein [Pricia sp.]|nr:ROK family protein [Pricia sp.]
MFKQNENIWGIDLGGTKIEGAILKSREEPEVLYRERTLTEADLGYDHVLSQIDKLIANMEAEAGYRPKNLGICTPGTLIPSNGLMKNSNADALNGKPMQKDLAKMMGMNVEMANDANCFALAETKLGIVKQKYPTAKVVFGVIMGTGVGGGLVVNGQIVGGHHGIGGEWGHNYLHGFEGRQCYCGKQGCNESVLSGPSLEWFYEKNTGVKRTMKEIVARARLGSDQVAVETLDRLTSGFAVAASVLVNIVDPDVIVIGGGLGNIPELYDKGVNNIYKNVFDHEFNAPVVKPLLGDSAGVFGAAFLNA